MALPMVVWGRVGMGGGRGPAAVEEDLGGRCGGGFGGAGGGLGGAGGGGRGPGGWWEDSMEVEADSVALEVVSTVVV